MRPEAPYFAQSRTNARGEAAQILGRAAHGTMAPEPTIFLVDDDPAVRDSLKVSLEAHGYSVSDFASGQDFLHSYAGGPRHCLVLDVHMPVVSGIEVLEHLAAQRRAPPTVMITGLNDVGTRHRALAAGAFAVLEKPFDASQLIITMRSAMNAAGSGAANH